MKFLGIALLLVSCAHRLPVETRPSWVSAIRTGEQGLKITHGNKIFYRRIAGSKDVSKQTSCNLVVMKAEEDLKKEFPSVPKVPYTVEVLFYDQEHHDCAVTISILKNFKHQYTSMLTSEAETINRKIALESKDVVSEDEASEIVLIRSELAMKYALTGLTKTEFEKFAKDKVHVLEEKNMCTQVFNTNAYSIHGLTHVCWKGEIIAGYCTSKDKQCWTRTP
jgi:hypothetical protein